MTYVIVAVVYIYQVGNVANKLCMLFPLSSTGLPPYPYLLAIPSPLFSPSMPFPLPALHSLFSLCVQLSQVYTTFVNKTTGQLSVITSFLNWSGTAARIFTTLQETQDPIILITYTSSFIVNSIIMLQFGIYWNATSKDSRKKE